MRGRTDPRRSLWQARLGAAVVVLLAAALSWGALAHPALAGRPPTPTPTPAPTNTPTPTPGCTTSFALASHADRNGVYFDQFLGVAAVSASDVWAVGADDAATPPGQLADLTETLIEHWNGTTWSIVPSPNSASGGYLAGVGALSSTNVWAVGSTDDAYIGQTLIEHWDGATWSLVPSPSPSGATNSYLAGVAGVAANDVWAVGYANYPGSTPGVTVMQTLTEHWNGIAWSIVPSPNFSTTLADQLAAVTAIAGNNVWAVGDTQTLPYYQDSTLILHWDGTSWKIDSSFSTSGGLSGVSATSASDIWAVGSGGPNYTPLVLHRNGTAWSTVASPGVQYDYNVLKSVDALTTSDVWAAGYAENVSYITDGDQVYNYSPLVEHWDGAAWSIVSSADPVPFSGQTGSTAILHGIAGAAAADVWAAGDFGITGGSRSLIEREVCQ
ncbi:MAG TPA: hypothetical protein VF916_11210 [Ktedonobacterales bacterium]